MNISYPYSRSRVTISVRRLLVCVAVVAGVLTLEREWDYHRRDPASEKLLRPIISDYEKQIAITRIEQKGHISTALTMSNSFAESFMFRMTNLACAVFDRPMTQDAVKQGWITAMIHLRAIRTNYSYFTEGRGFVLMVLNEYRSAAVRGREILYYIRLRDHFQRLRAEHRVAIPPLPPEFEAERRELEVELRQARGSSARVWPPDPYWFLPPGTPRPKVKPTVWSHDSM